MIPTQIPIRCQCLTNIICYLNNSFSINQTFHPQLSRKGKANKTLADLSLRFFNTEVNVKRHLQGIVSRGWISGQSVDPHYFKLLGSTTPSSSTSSNKQMNPTQRIEYSQPVALHMNPAEGSRLPLVETSNNNVMNHHKKTDMQSESQQNQTNIDDSNQEPPKQFYLQCMFVLIFLNLSIKFYFDFNYF